MFNAQNRIRQLMAERGWTIYRLAQESGLSQTTISNIFKRNNQREALAAFIKTIV